MWTSSLSSISEMKVASTGRISKTTGCTAACTLSPPLDTGMWPSQCLAQGGCSYHCLRQRQSPTYLCRLRPVDVGFMKALHEKVNIVPLIAKADCLVPSEIRKLKDRVSLRQLRGHLAKNYRGAGPC